MADAAKKQENRGGKRPGAGRPKGSRETLSVRQVNAMLQAAKKAAKKHGGISLDDLLLSYAYGEDPIQGRTVNVQQSMAAIKLYKDKTMARIEEGGATDVSATEGPAYYLPEQRPRLEAVKD